LDATLLDYLNSTCTSSGARMMLGSSGGNDADDGGPATTWRTDEPCQAAVRMLGDHQWGGGI
jgi:hypothetical protein